MHVLGIVGTADVETTRLVETLTDRLADRGRVATIASTRSEMSKATGPTYRESGATSSYELSEDGWTGAGENRTLAETLDDLAPTHEYALVEGFPEAAIPQVVLGDAEYAGEAIAMGDRGDAIDPEGAIDALEASEPYVTLESLVRRAKGSPRADRAGAIATFTGRVRKKDSADDAPTEFLEFETYEGVAQQRFTTIREELEAREGIYEVLMHHRTGVIEAGADIVFVVVLAGHRKEAFRAVEDGIDRLKDEVPIFKKEVTADEEFWVHTRV
ncbi:molybdopterin synthase [Halalkalicoccus jeotgali]|uniref:Bifunctional molybdopterin-guanine dinucleotide biosynthesis protein MobB/MoaE n=1 Tax=Halalkalicoccus jeotgali (strain DSM 18796 / CECT 7217 / JCM 14584 / KCTC 4019 / B3) TaxID=795797 RepID=D8J8R5_HALJB|nr:molybdopterin synthase [Halalkalicoccus jeotgali]ADJ14250.1 putative bifunctional molybdopterin-guanine dinucleotide biosynthesis protein MobB/MoaE [Halalkalicoccus jeotgali B3]ELY40512.1 bifunctional molybdopterin-guanine dinucleotide biosynthesis protein MobB/MoaE [Halalkalicoccus jeotgali B3]